MTTVELDPDPTPTRTPWQEYLTAAQGLDAVRRAIADEAAAATRTISSARAELARARARLDAQRQQLIVEAVCEGVPMPPLEPSSAERSWGRATVTSGAAGALAALGHAHTLIDAADAYLRGAPPPVGPLLDAAPESTARPWLIGAVAGSVAVLLLCALVVVAVLLVA